MKNISENEIKEINEALNNGHLTVKKLLFILIKAYIEGKGDCKVYLDVPATEELGEDSSIWEATRPYWWDDGFKEVNEPSHDHLHIVLGECIAC